MTESQVTEDVSDAGRWRRSAADPVGRWKAGVGGGSGTVLWDRAGLRCGSRVQRTAQDQGNRPATHRRLSHLAVEVLLPRRHLVLPFHPPSCPPQGRPRPRAPPHHCPRAPGLHSLSWPDRNAA